MSKLISSILLVEDDAGHAALISRVLKDFADNVNVSPTIENAKECLSNELFTLVVTDLNLPGSKGVTHVQEFQQIAPNTPVIVLSSSQSLKDVVLAMQMGAKDYVVKEFNDDFKELVGLSLSRVYAAILLEQEHRKLQSQMRALRIAIESSADGLAVLGEQGQIQYCNRAFTEIVETLGGTPTNILECFSQAVKRRDTLIRELTEKLNNLQDGLVWGTEVALESKKDVAFDLSYYAVSAHGEGDTAAKPEKMAVVWFRDISERKRHDTLQREILSTTTHDLKGPLGAISLSADMLQDLVESNDRATEIVKRIASSSRGALNLIDEFLSARRIQSGNFILKPVELDLVRLVDETAEDYRALAIAKNIDLRVEAYPEPLKVSVDKLGLTRVLGNLLANAVKFTQKGGTVVVTIGSTDDEYTLAVTDNGKGMEPSEVQKIFERYTRLEKHKGVEGTGLGLFVVKAIVNAHGGRVEVQSRPDQGTTFLLILPKSPQVDERGEILSLVFA